MPQQAATIESLPQAFEVVKEMQADGPDRGEGCRPLGRQAPAGIIEGRMAEAVDVWRDTLDAGAMRDRRNGTCRRCLLGALGDIERDVPRTRHFCPTGVPKGSARRAPEIDRAIPAGVVPGLSIRKVGEVLPGRPVPAATVSRVAGTLDRSVDAFHRHRTTVPRGAQTNPAHGNLPGPDIDGPHPPRGLHPRRQVSGNQYPGLRACS